MLCRRRRQAAYAAAATATAAAALLAIQGRGRADSPRRTPQTHWLGPQLQQQPGPSAAGAPPGPKPAPFVVL
jgi:hypothetical protein